MGWKRSWSDLRQGLKTFDLFFKNEIIFIMFQYKWTMGVSDQGLYGYVLYGFRFLDEKNLRL